MAKFDIFIAQKVINLFHKYILLRRGPAEKEWLKHFPKQLAFFTHSLADRIKINLYKDSHLSKFIYDGFEKKEELFIQQFLKPGDVFFDIGANIGLHSLIAAKAIGNGGKAYAFEPTPITFDRLNDNIRLNNFEAIISSFNLGVSDSNEKLYLNVSESGYDAWNSFAPIKEITLEQKIEVDVVTIPDFVQQHKLEPKNIALIKIDVEGWELNVLKGMESFFNDDSFNASFLIEFTEENAFRAGYSCRDLYNFMVSKGYEWFDLNEKTLQLEHAELKAYYPYENLIAIKKINIPSVKQRLHTI
ncbi:FkbM family methyltransferase [Pedobacter jeongneungensis]|uniref:FkbM family methyltransferase n=1 Tax=Pedobacter jeongneungensis TaxID=947309 RepID=UPI0004689EC6|nr:FkbM family methyltransferase [Pedobacter jeongneungensis]